MKYLFVLLLLCQSLTAQVSLKNANIHNAQLAVTVSGTGGGDTPFITSGHGTSRNNFDGSVGCKFTPSSTITVTSLGRLVLAGNSATHVVYIVNTDGSILVQQTIPTSGITANTYSYVAITPTTLVSGTTYYLQQLEVNGGDSWYDDSGTITTTAVGTISFSAHIAGGPPGLPTDDTSGSFSFGNPNFLYH